MGKQLRRDLLKAEGAVGAAAAVDGVAEHILGLGHDDGDGGESLRVDLDIGIIHCVLLQRLEQAPAQRVAAYPGDQGHRKAKTAHWWAHRREAR